MIRRENACMGDSEGVKSCGTFVQASRLHNEVVVSRRSKQENEFCCACMTNKPRDESSRPAGPVRQTASLFHFPSLTAPFLFRPVRLVSAPANPVYDLC